MKNKTTDLLALERVLELGTRCLNPDLFASLEDIVAQIKPSVENRTRDEPPSKLTLMLNSKPIDLRE